MINILERHFLIRKLNLYQKVGRIHDYSYSLLFTSTNDVMFFSWGT